MARLCRRRLLQATACGFPALNLAGLMQARAAATTTPGAGRIKSCIFVFYYGGPSHLDTFDPKPGAPAEVRGEFDSIDTSAPGVRLSEHLPMLSRTMHKAALVRTMHHKMRAHDAASAETLTGRTPIGGDQPVIPETPLTFPSYGASLGYCWRDRNLPVVQASLPYVMKNVVHNPGQTPGFLGAEYGPFQITGDPQSMSYRVDALRLPDDLPSQRLTDRRELLESLTQHGAVGPSPASAALEQHYRKAFDLLGSEAVRKALELAREPKAVRERYGLRPEQAPTPAELQLRNGAHLDVTRMLRGQNLLVARRLVEAGVPFVNVYDYKTQGRNWDAHQDNFRQHKHFLLPQADRALSALIEDLDERGLLETTLVVGVGEFGRSPTINKNAGRDHWPDCYSVLLAGGGVVGGAVYGASDKIGAYPAADPVSPADLAATIFWRFGIDPATEIHDLSGRPFKVADGKPLERLFA